MGGSFDFELVCIGSGPAGQRAAVQAAKLGRRATVVEKRRAVGGVCIGTGTIPSKTLREAVLTFSGLAGKGDRLPWAKLPTSFMTHTVIERVTRRGPGEWVRVTHSRLARLRNSGTEWERFTDDRYGVGCQRTHPPSPRRVTRSSHAWPVHA